jgi:hypothetical protein
MVRTIERTAPSVREWDPAFGGPWVDLLARAGAAVSSADAAAIGALCEELESAAEGEHRTVHGALIINLRNILEAMDAVAAAQPVRAAVRHPLALR